MIDIFDTLAPLFLIFEVISSIEAAGFVQGDEACAFDEEERFCDVEDNVVVFTFKSEPASDIIAINSEVLLPKSSAEFRSDPISPYIPSLSDSFKLKNYNYLPHSYPIVYSIHPFFVWYLLT